MTPAIIAIVLVAIAGGAVIVIRKRLRLKGEVSHSLGLALLKIQLPRTGKSEEGSTSGIAGIREKIAVMESVITQLGGIEEKGIKAWLYGRPFFSFEIVVPHVGQEVLFYCAVPRVYVTTAEKLIQGVYPDAQIEKTNDYTVFHPDGAISAATIRGKNRYLPLKSYQTLETDPLNGILNAFSKVAGESEGLALQIIAQKAEGEYNKRLSSIARQLKKGKSLGEALSESGKSGLTKALAQSSGKKEEPQTSTGPVNEPQVQSVEKKSQKPLFTTNIRLIAAAKTQERADALLQELATPFLQFNNEGTNTLTIRKETGRVLQKIVYQYSFRVPDYQLSTILSSEEFSSIIHLPNTITGSANLSSVKAKTAPAPLNLPQTGLALGTNRYRGVATDVRLAVEDRLRHFYVIGQTGTGKSYLMRNMIIQDMQNGNGVCFIDPHGDMAEELLSCVPANRVKDVIYFNPGDIQRPMGINMLEYDPNYPEQKTFIINELLEIFNKLYDMKTAGGPMFEQYFRNATALVMDDPESGNTLLEINRVFVDKKFRDYKLSRTTNPLVKTFWREVAEKAGGEAALANIVPYISSKFDSFLSNEIMRPIVAQEHSAFKLRDVMDSQKILLINLSKGRLGELNSSLIGLIMVGKLLMAAFSRVDIPEAQRKNFYLYIDEFQNVTTNSIETILSEARKYKLGLTIAHQFIAQLSDEIKAAVFGNVGSLACFRVGAEDAEFLEKQFAPTFGAPDLIDIDNRKCYVKLLVGGQTAPAFSMETNAGITGNPATSASAKEFSRLTYGRDRADVENEIRIKFEATEKKPPAPPAGI